jgi:hypothetical protein
MRFLIFIIVLMASLPVVPKEANPYTEFRKDTYDLQQEYLARLAEHQSIVMKDLESKLAQQKWQTNAIAIMVYVMVGMGLWLSYLQFKRDGVKDGKSSIQLKMGTGSIEINSSVIGLAILAMSFWFFQTYIDKVYAVDVQQIPPFDFTTYGVNR